MAATRGKLTKHQQDQVRSAIKTTQLVKRLQCFALEEKGDQGEAVELDANRLRAIETLLRKTVPDLKAIEHTGADGGPIQIEGSSDEELMARLAQLRAIQEG